MSASLRLLPVKATCAPPGAMLNVPCRLLPSDSSERSARSRPRRISWKRSLPPRSVRNKSDGSLAVK